MPAVVSIVSLTRGHWYLHVDPWFYSSFEMEHAVRAVSPDHVAAVQAGHSSEQDKERSGILQRCGRDPPLAYHLGYAFYTANTNDHKLG